MKIVCFILISLFSYPMLANTAKTDSLLFALNKSEGDTKLDLIFQLQYSGDVPLSELNKLSNEAVAMCGYDSAYMGKAYIIKGLVLTNKYIDSVSYYLYKGLSKEEAINNPYFLIKAWLTLANLPTANADEQKKCLNNALIIINENKDISKADYYSTVAEIAFKKGEEKKGIKYYEKASDIYIKENKFSSFAKTSLYLAQLSYGEGDYDKSSLLLDNVFKYENQLSNNAKSSLYYCAGTMFFYRGFNLDERIELYRKAIYYSVIIEDSFVIASIKSNLGTICIESNMIDSAITIIKECIPFFKDTDRNKGTNYYHLVIAYGIKNDYQTAFMYSDSASKIFLKLKDYKRYNKLLVELANLYSLEGKYEEAEMYFDSVKNYVDTSEYIRTKVKFLYFYKNHFERQGNYKRAYEVFEKYSAFNDSIVELENKNKIDELKIKWETVKKDHENFVLTTSIELEKKKSKKQKVQIKLLYYFIIGLAIFVILLVIIFILFRKNILNKRKLNIERLLRLEKENMLIKQKRLSTEQKLQSKTTLLKVTNNNLLQKAMLTSKLIGWLKSMRPYINDSGLKILQSNLAEVANYSIDSNWVDFERNFSELYPYAQLNIRKAVPKLSKADFRITCFMIMKLSNSEIAMITLQSVNSLRTAKFRLRSKFKVNTNEELMSKLESIISNKS